MASPLTGQPSSKKNNLAEHVTVNLVDLFRHALDVISHFFVQNVASDAVEASSTTTVINATSHQAKVGDIIRFTSGTHQTVEVVVLSTETNSFTIAQELSVAPSAADTFDILRHTKPLVSSDGTVQVSGGGGGSGTEYTEDAAAPANPVGGVQQLVRQDTPAGLVSANGDILTRRGTDFGAAFTQILDSSGNFIDTFGSGVLTGTRHNGSLTPAGIGAAYATLLNPGVAVHSVHIYNFTDGDIVISFDGGVTDHWVLGRGERETFNYGSNGLELSDNIEIKDGTNAPANGVVYALAYSG